MAQLVAFGAPQQPPTVIAALAALFVALVVVLVTARWVRRAPTGQPTGYVRRSALDGALLGLGSAAVADNIVFHWVLEAHRFVEDWPGSIYVEAALVAVGAIVTVISLRRLRDRLRGARSA